MHTSEKNSVFNQTHLLKRVLIISPHFPPANTADMQRVRMSLPYFKELGWESEVITVDEKHYDVVKDELLMDSIPDDIKIHKVKALNKKFTSKFGLGSLALRSLWFIRQKGNELLAKSKFDLVYFSTTEFPVCILGAYWKRKYKIPYVIDMQDPWHTDYYKNKPKIERPKKYWFSYRLHKYLEPIAMKHVDGIISVSDDYVRTLQERYTQLRAKPTSVITFGAFGTDFDIAKSHNQELSLTFQPSNKINLVYIGRGGFDMKPALSTLFGAFKQGMILQSELFDNVHMHFIGTSYAPKGQGIPTIIPVASEFDISAHVTEHTDRIGFYQSLKNMQHADGLIIIGSNEAAYTASKLYPYVLAKKQLFAVMHPESSGVKVIGDCNAGYLVPIGETIEKATQALTDYLNSICMQVSTATDWEAFEKYTASNMAKKQVVLFNTVIKE